MSAKQARAARLANLWRRLWPLSPARAARSWQYQRRGDTPAVRLPLRRRYARVGARKNLYEHKVSWMQDLPFVGFGP